MSHQGPCLRHVSRGTPVSLTALRAGHAEKPSTLRQPQIARVCTCVAARVLMQTVMPCHGAVC